MAQPTTPFHPGVVSAVPAAQPGLRPTRWPETLLIFGLPALGLAVAYYYVSPALASLMPLGEARILAGGLVMIAMILAAVVGVAREGHPATWPAFAARLRLNRMDGRAWLWTAGSTVVYVALALVANAVVPPIYRAIGFTPPIETAEPWGLSALPLVLAGLALNILGEELWWRGYVLPRQELQFGPLAWLWHGLMWACFHAFKWWTIPALLFVCPVVPFVALRTRNTYPGMVSHLIVNGLGILLVAIQLLAR
jgi:membrane protease YdiL (CAAX protease family)